MMKKRILLIMPNHVGLITQIKNNLEYHGYIVCAYSNQYLESNFQHPNLKSYLHKFLPKYKNSPLKKSLQKEWATAQLTKYLGNELFDYTLVIRPDLFAKSLIELLRCHTKTTLSAYQWDGFDRHPEVIPLINLFDRFFVFNYRDILNHNELSLLGITNFYFDLYSQEKSYNNNLAYFLGSHIKERIDPINYCANILTDLGIDLNFIIATRKSKHKRSYKNKKINFIDKEIDFKANLDNVIHAGILLDFVNPVHQGLSFRIFEALYYHKKLITNNPAVKNYDFYHPNNIFIWDGHDLSGLSEFLLCPFQAINKAIIEKYSFGNWLKNILDLSPYQTIELPKKI